MELPKKQLTNDETNLLNTGFLNAISAIYHKLETDVDKEAFSKMVTATVGDENLKDGINEKTIDSSANGGTPAGCVWVRGIGLVCD